MQLVYVLNKDGLPLMPTHKLGKVRHLLKEGHAKIIKRNPFTIKLNYESNNYTQDVTLGVDAGSKLFITGYFDRYVQSFLTGVSGQN